MKTLSASALENIRRRQTYLLWSGCIREIVMSGERSRGARVETLIPGDLSGTLMWADIDYGYAGSDRSRWRPAEHFYRLSEVLYYEGRERLATDAAYREKIVMALRFWILHDFRNDNWWHNDIGMPIHMADLALMTEEYLPSDVRDGLIALAARGSAKTRSDVEKWTGANLIWGMQTTVKHALLTHDAALLVRAAGRVAQEMSVGAEGIRADGAFCQHGNRWYSGGYGVSFTFDMAQLVYLFSGSELAFPTERVEVLLLHVLDGQRRMGYRGYLDYNSVGREISRPGALKKRELAFGVSLLARTEGIPRREELCRFRDELTRGIADTSADGTVFYPSISFLSHRACGRYIGVRGLTAGQLDAEVCNSEGVLCVNMSYGSRVCMMAQGDEYYDINPVWDYARVPGTTAREESDARLSARTRWSERSLPNDRTGSAVGTGCGVLHEVAEHDGITAYTAFFVFDGCLAALGAGIRDVREGEKLPLAVTVDQAWTRDATPDGDYAPAGRLSPEGMVLPDGEGAVPSNGAFSYCNLDDTTRLVTRHGIRRGSWHRNSLERPDAPVQGDVFLVTVPVERQDATYAYSVVPRGGDARVRVLSNTPACQAVACRREDGSETVMAVFREAGALTVRTAEGETLTVRGERGTCRIRT